jgi:GMP synthase-like glutamine amidotransferase
VFPLTPTPAGWSDPLMQDLENATPVVERRLWGVLNPPAATRTGAVVLAYSSIGDVAAARFTANAAGTIFQPELKTDGTASTVLSRFVRLAVEPT